MSVIGNSYVDMVDVIKQRGPDGKVTGEIIDMMSELTPVFRNGWHAPCNKGKSHQHNIRVGLSSVAWGRLYKGIAQSKSGFVQVEDTTGFVEGRSTIDRRLLKLHPGEENQIKLNESSGFMEAIAQEFETGFFYHDTATAPEKFKGLAARYNQIQTSGAGRQIIDAGGAGSDNTSVWFVTWGNNFTSLIHPEGSDMGVEHEDHGTQRVEDANGNPFYAQEDTWTLHVGCSVGDWRYNSRVANIDVSDLRAGNVDIYGFMREAYWRLKSRTIPGGTQAIYMNADVLEALDRANTNSDSGDNFIRLRPGELDGKEIMSFRGMPIYESEAILNTEARVTT
ncbi:MAG: major capsid protein [Pseudomonadota bacterium]